MNSILSIEIKMYTCVKIKLMILVYLKLIVTYYDSVYEIVTLNLQQYD